MAGWAVQLSSEIILQRPPFTDLALGGIGKGSCSHTSHHLVAKDTGT